ncbi:MAG: fe-S protein assembly co-chaperone HscB [Pseudomonadota bacterium]|jgi:molecular chaperone HscB|nr:Fe-S protein assembly co-chaperone HscB [Oxalobacteraceae bacterium]
MDNHFALFQMPVGFDIDIEQLDAAFRELQGRVHPDRFVSASDAEKRVAMQWATRANEAYQTLKNPLKRAAYLCELNGVDLGVESNTAMPPAFLMQQMEWREALDEARDARDVGALETLERELAGVRRERLTQISDLFGSGHYEAAGAQVRQLMFLEKFGEDVGRVFESIEA